MPSQHKSVLAAQSPVPAAQRPSREGSLVILPKEALEQPSNRPWPEVLRERTGIPLQIGYEAVNKETTALLWLDHSAKGVPNLEKVLKENEQIRWIQLPMAGVNAYSDLIKSDLGKDRLWTSAKGAYAQPVAEHALTLSLALLRFLPRRILATSWGKPAGESLFGQNVVIVGAGGIAISLIEQLQPFNCNITVLRRSVQGAWPEHLSHVKIDSYTNLDEHLPHAGLVVLAAAATPDTLNLFRLQQFERMRKEAVLVNVARGELIATDDLATALERGLIAGAGIDVTAPEPLPAEHKLWQLLKNPEHNLIITPHTADTPEMIFPLLSQRMVDNVTALQKGDGNFVGRVDTAAGY